MPKTPPHPSSREPPLSAKVPQTTPGRLIDVGDLLGEAREATLVHAGEHYRLRVTANGKLILTK